MVPKTYRVLETKRDTHDTFTMVLEPSSRAKSMTFAPGQFNMLYAFGVGECAISISGDPSGQEPLTHTTRVVGTVTRALHDLRPGDMMGVRGPFGRPWPVCDAEGYDLVLVAGGIGLAPLRPVLHHVMAHRERYGKVVLLYGARTPSDILYRREVERWRGRLDLDVFATVDRADAHWRGNVGVVTPLIQRAPFDRNNTIALVCGPEIMMRYATAEFQKRGVPDTQIFVSMERNMKCATGVCGHCQYGPAFVCKDGPVFSFDQMAHWFAQREL